MFSLSLAGIGIFISPMVAPQVSLERENDFRVLLSRDVLSFEERLKAQTQAQAETEIENFYLTVDSIGLYNAPVIKDVRVADKRDYEDSLQRGLVQAEGSQFPGEGGLVYIFGHSTNYPWLIKEMNALFYNLDHIQNGDKIKVEYNDKHFLYYVYDSKVVNPDQVEAIKEKLGEDVLVLQTCWPKGTYLKRLLVFAKPSLFGSLLN